jgi:hypothetical protein
MQIENLKMKKKRNNLSGRNSFALCILHSTLCIGAKRLSLWQNRGGGDEG